MNRRVVPGCVLPIFLMAVCAAGYAAEVVPLMETPAAADILANVSSNKKAHHALLMPPVGSNPGVLFEKRGFFDTVTFSLVRPGEPAKAIWSGEDEKADMKCADDASGFVLAEYDKPALNRKMVRVRVFGATGREVSSYVPNDKEKLVAALTGESALFVELATDGSRVLRSRDKTGKQIAQAGPYPVKECAWTSDGSRLLVNVAQWAGRPALPTNPPGGVGPSKEVLIVDMKSGKTLYTLPAASRAQMSPDGNLVVTVADDGHLVFWIEGKKVKTIDLPTPATFAVFSLDGAYVAFTVGDECRMYRVKDWTLTMTVKPPSGHRFGIDSASISNSGRLLIGTFMPDRNPAEPSNILCLYESDGTTLWMRRFPWKDGRGTWQGNSRLSPDGKETYVKMADKVIRVAFPAK